MRSWKHAACLMAGILVSLGGVSSGGFAVYNDLGGFTADTNTSLVEDFEAVGPKNVELASFTSNGITYTGVQADNPNVWVASAGYTNFGLGGGATTSSVLTANGNEVFEIDFGALATTAVGFDVYVNGIGPVTTEYFDAADNVILTISDGRPAGAVLFLGLLSDEPIHKIRWTAVGGEKINTGIDNLRLGTAAGPVVPAPGAMLLGALGTGLVGLFRRRRSL